jgi:homocysteine S-methyltransferase
LVPGGTVAFGTDAGFGNLTEFGEETADLTHILPNLHILGGCCGTDHHHTAKISDNISG